MGPAESQSRRYKAEEYFALEAASDVRHEFFEGEIFAMAGGTGRHNDLVQNFVLALRPKLRGSTCRLKVETMRLAVRQNRHYVYPDVMVSATPTTNARNSSTSIRCSSWKCCRPPPKPTTGVASFAATSSYRPCGITCWYRRKSGWWSGSAKTSTVAGIIPPWRRPPTLARAWRGADPGRSVRGNGHRAHAREPPAGR